MTTEQKIQAMVNSGISEEEARFIQAIEDGEIEGDVVEIDKSGNETKALPARVPQPLEPWSDEEMDELSMVGPDDVKAALESRSPELREILESRTNPDE